MRLTGFFAITWIVQLIVGVVLFTVSLLIENQVFQSFFTAPLIALALAAALEVGKAMSIVWHRYLSHHGEFTYPVATRVFSSGFRVGLVLLSALCSLLYLGVALDRPNLEAVRAADLAAIDARLQSDLSGLDTERQARISADQARRDREYADTRRDHQGQVDELEALLRAEMDNVVGGVFKGARYQEIQSRLKQARDARDQALKDLSARHQAQADQRAAGLDATQRAERTRLVDAAQARRQAAHAESFDGDERTHNPSVVTLMRVSEAVFGLQMTAPAFVFLFSLFISLLIELGILLAFDTVTLAILPALAAQHREEVLKEALLAEVSGTAARDEIRHRGAMDRVRKGADRAVEKARAHAEPYAQGPRKAA